MFGIPIAKFRKAPRIAAGDRTTVSVGFSEAIPPLAFCKFRVSLLRREIIPCFDLSLRLVNMRKSLRCK